MEQSIPNPPVERYGLGGIGLHTKRELISHLQYHLEVLSKNCRMNRQPRRPKVFNNVWDFRSYDIELTIGIIH